MRSRCNRPNYPEAHLYFNRGIKVCAEWEDFSKFYTWALSHGWQNGLFLDRIDNDKGYSQENCRFVTASITS